MRNKEFNMDDLVEAMRDPFKTKDLSSSRSKTISDRENDPENFIKRITPQIIEVYQQGLGYKTPKEWDESFYILGGGQSRRTSNAILERMAWDQFLEKVAIIVVELGE